jgi:uncharacterized protein (DUF433 family)
MADVITERITRTPGICGGKACIAGHRVRVLDVVIWHEHLGMTADQIVAENPALTMSDVHAALAYYFDHIEEIRADIDRNDEIVKRLRRSYPSKLRERLGAGSDQVLP